MKKIIIITLLFALSLSGSAYAKKRLDANSQSVQLLKTLTEEGRIIREKDIPVEKADVDADTKRINLLKQKFNEDIAFPATKTKKSPNEKPSGTIE